MDDKLIIDTNIEELESYSDDSLYNISSFGNDMNLRQIIEMYNDGDIEKPELQRKYVWSKKEASRFIDSILLGLPVPSIFLAKSNDNKLLIVDGYQRIMTINDYVNGHFSNERTTFKLSDSKTINKRWRGKSYLDLSEDEKRSLRMYTIHAIIFEQKTPRDDTAMYQVFERINTGGRVLKPQEIRNCIYHGSFNDLLMELNKLEVWRNIIGDKKEANRMEDIELILRFFSFADFDKMIKEDTSQINLVNYLNCYMCCKKNVSMVEKEELKEKFISTIEYLYFQLGEKVFRNCQIKNNKIIWSKKINPVIFDAICYATIVAKDYLNNINLDEKYQELLLNEEFATVIKERTTNITNIVKRQNIALNILYGINDVRR